MANPESFAPAGRPAILFNVAANIDPADALNFASSFLTMAIDLGGNPDGLSENARWVCVHLTEMARALVEAAIERSAK